MAQTEISQNVPLSFSVPFKKNKKNKKYIQN